MTSNTGEDPGSGGQALALDDVDRAIVAVLRSDYRLPRLGGSAVVRVRPVRVRALEDHRSLATSYLFSAAFEAAGTPPIAPSET